MVNLYPFEETVARGAAHDDCIENIDIGGPAMIRAAAKNHAYVAIVTDPSDYPELLAELEAGCTAPVGAIAEVVDSLDDDGRVTRMRVTGVSSWPEEDYLARRGAAWT